MLYFQHGMVAWFHVQLIDITACVFHSRQHSMTDNQTDKQADQTRRHKKRNTEVFSGRHSKFEGKPRSMLYLRISGMAYRSSTEFLGTSYSRS